MDERKAEGAANGPPLHHIAERVLGRPLFLHPTKAEIVLRVLDGRLSQQGVAESALPPDATRFMGTRRRSNDSWSFNPAVSGVAIISVVGSLVNRGAWVGASSGLVSYEGIAAQVRDAKSDSEIHSVILDLDTPGGEATGMFAVAELIRDLAQSKHVVAVVNDMAASAGYGIASAAHEIVVSPTSIVGSIGVVMTHVDASEKLKKDGYAVTQIFEGDHKVDGNPFGPLSDAVKGDLQQECRQFYSLFVAMVAAGRGDRLTEEMARATQARVFIGADAVSRGLADRVASFDTVLADLSSRGAGGSARTQERSFAMSKPNGAPEAENTGITQDAHDAAVAQARADGARDERARMSSIMSLEEAKDRPKQAMNFALKTDLDADAVKTLLADSPKETAGDAGYQTIEQRAAAEKEIGGGASPMKTKGTAVEDGWNAELKAAGAQ